MGMTSNDPSYDIDTDSAETTISPTRRRARASAAFNVSSPSSTHHHHHHHTSSTTRALTPRGGNPRSPYRGMSFASAPSTATTISETTAIIPMPVLQLLPPISHDSTSHRQRHTTTTSSSHSSTMSQSSGTSFSATGSGVTISSIPSSSSSLSSSTSSLFSPRPFPLVSAPSSHGSRSGWQFDDASLRVPTKDDVSSILNQLLGNGESWTQLSALFLRVSSCPPSICCHLLVQDTN
jgi:hypothetical protein